MRLALLLTLVLLAGCGKGGTQAESLAPAQLPEPVLKAARETLPGVSFHKAWKGPGGIYGLRGKSKQGKTRTLEITPAGKVVKIE